MKCSGDLRSKSDSPGTLYQTNPRRLGLVHHQTDVSSTQKGDDLFGKHRPLASTDVKPTALAGERLFLRLDKGVRHGMSR